jgi:hypothetical protein
MFVEPCWMRRMCGAALFSIALVAGGCNKLDDGRLRSYPVHGKVTIDGKPVKGVYVTLVPEKQPPTHGIWPNAITDDQGEYWISTYDSEDGAPLGEYVVTAKWPKGEGLMVNSESPDRLENRYNDPKTSTIKLTVKEATKAEPNTVPDLTLTSK